MSNFTHEVTKSIAEPLTQQTASRSMHVGPVLAATPAVAAGAAVVGSAAIAYAVEEAGDG